MAWVWASQVSGSLSVMYRMDSWVLEGSEADGLVVVVGFDVDDGAFVGWVGDSFGVFVESIGAGHDSSFL